MTNTPSEADVRAGFAAYTPRNLRTYDLGVAVTCSLFWGCHKRELRRQYSQNVSAEHLDIGVGTGYLLDNCRFPTATPKITLFDMSPHALNYTARRLARYDVSTCRGNVLEPFPLPRASFGSAAMSLMLHCVPGDLESKGVALEHAAACVRPGGRLFGSTVLSRGVHLPLHTRLLMRALNSDGRFNNTADSLDDLHAQLRSRFSDYRVTVHGCTALFEATVP